ncbi:MAG: chloride channel protein [Planctomycetaceae bacterium]
MTLDRFLRSLDWKATGKWMLLSVSVGVIAGAGGVLFVLLSQCVSHFSLYEYSGFLPGEAAGEHAVFKHPEKELLPWITTIIMTIGGLLSGWLVYTFAPEAEGHGTDAAIDAFHNKRGVIRARIPFIKTVASAITLGTGGSGGREGPIAQIGAGFGSYLATALKLTVRDRRILLAAGVGAGIGAVFRAPLAGALFAAEILYSGPDIETDVIIPAATSAIIGYSVFRMLAEQLPGAHSGYGPLFGHLQLSFSSPLELIPYAGLALVLTLVGVLYIKTFYGTQKVFAKLPIPRVVRPALGAFIAGLCGVVLYLVVFPQDRRALAVLATGYGTLQEALANPDQIGIPILATVALVKILTTSLTISSGGSGGVFGPSMVIGGCAGAAVGLAFNQVWPGHIDPSAFALVGMAGFFSGCAHAPFSTIIMVSELTGSYELLLPTMWVSTLCFVLGQRWQLYVKQVPSRLESPAHRGDFLVDVLEGILVKDVLRPNLESLRKIPESTSLEDIVHILAETRQHYFPVVDDQDRMVGIFSGDDVRHYLYDETIWTLAVARDVMDTKVVAVTPDDDLNTAMRAFTSIAIDELPVVAADDRSKLLGTLRHKDTIAAYNRRLMEFKKAGEEG